MAMDPETTASQVLKDYGCCPRCIIRLLRGVLDVCKGELQGEKPRIMPMCPTCLGLLHHPNLCDTPHQVEGDVSNLLISITERVRESDFQSLAYQLRPIDPVALSIRDHLVWNKLFRAAEQDSLVIDNDASLKNGGKLTRNKVEAWRRGRVSVKLAWQWIVEPQLTVLLQAPFIQSTEEVTCAEFLTKHNLPISLPQPESLILIVEVELGSTGSAEDCVTLVQEAGQLNLGPIRFCLDELDKSQHRRNGRKRTRGIQTETAPVQPPKEEIGLRYSKTNLQPLLTELEKLECFISFNLSNDKSRLASLESVRFSRLVPLVLAGRYVKLSRRLPQTPWILNGKRKLPSSVEELIVAPIREQLGTAARLTFISSGREDVDVRCLGLGRPFMIQIEDYARSVDHLSRVYFPDSPTSTKPLDEAASYGLLELASQINSQTEGRVFVRDLQLVHPKEAAKAIKNGELEKAKCYRAVCWCPHGGLTKELVQRIESHCTTNETELKEPNASSGKTASPIQVESDEPFCGSREFNAVPVVQSTPIRVLHRRSAMERHRTVRWLRVTDYQTALKSSSVENKDYISWSSLYPPEELFILELRCDAGTYVKEFVHGDLDRSRPSLAAIFQRQVDILCLDVIAVELDWPKRLQDPAVL